MHYVYAYVAGRSECSMLVLVKKTWVKKISLATHTKQNQNDETA